MVSDLFVVPAEISHLEKKESKPETRFNCRLNSFVTTEEYIQCNLFTQNKLNTVLNNNLIHKLPS